MFLILCSLNTITKISSFDLFWASKLHVTFVGNWIGLSSIRNQSILDDREVFFTLHLREKDHNNMKKQIQQSFLNKGIALRVTHSFWTWLKMSFLVGDPFEFQFSLSLLLLFLRASKVFWKNVFMSRRWKKPCIGKKNLSVHLEGQVPLRVGVRLSLRLNYISYTEASPQVEWRLPLTQCVHCVLSLPRSLC